MASPGPRVSSRKEGEVVTVTLDGPGRKNAMANDDWRVLTDVIRNIDVEVDRVVVIQGANHDFCAGADLGDGGGVPLSRLTTLNDACLAIHRLPVPTIAKVDGDAIGAGFNLALACDFIVATDRSRFSQIFGRRGLSVDFGGSWILPRLIGLHAAKELVLLGDIIDAASAKRMGLLRSVVQPAELDATVANLVGRLKAVAPVATRLSKQLLNDSFHSSLESSLAAEGLAQSLNLSMDDAKEAAAAFFEKRDPHFRGN